MGKRRSRNQLRRLKAKRRRVAKNRNVVGETSQPSTNKNISENEDIQVETLDDSAENVKEFNAILKEFHDLEQKQLDDDDDDDDYGKETTREIAIKDESKGTLIKSSDSKQPSTSSRNEKKLLSKRQFRKLYQIPLAILKIEASRPEIVDWMDADAPDPRMLIYLKSTHNAVPVPPRWRYSRGKTASIKREVLSKEPFELPGFIQQTGILAMRETTGDNEDTLKQRMRQRVQPKMGQLDLDFDKLYDAFFKYQVKPPMLGYGEVCEEGWAGYKDKTNKTMYNFTPGVMSLTLKSALGMPSGSNIPPWSDKMLEVGPPPCYPNMKVANNGEILIDGIHPGSGSQRSNTKPYGELEADESESESESEESSEEEEEEEEQGKVSDRDYLSEGDIPLETVGNKKPLGPAKKTKTSEETGPAYKVLKESHSGDHGSIYGAETTRYY